MGRGVWDKAPRCDVMGDAMRGEEEEEEGGGGGSVTQDCLFTQPNRVT